MKGEGGGRRGEVGGKLKLSLPCSTAHAATCMWARVAPTWMFSMLHLVHDPLSSSDEMSPEKWSIGSAEERWNLSS